RRCVRRWIGDGTNRHALGRRILYARLVGGIRLFAGTPQSRRVRGARRLFPVSFFGHSGLLFEFDLFVRADGLLAVHLHGFHAHDFIADKAHEVHILRRLAVDPLLPLDVRFFVLLTRLLRRTALGVGHHFAVHSHQHAMLLDGFLGLRRDSLEIRFQARLGV